MEFFGLKSLPNFINVIDRQSMAETVRSVQAPVP